VRAQKVSFLSTWSRQSSGFNVRTVQTAPAPAELTSFFKNRGEKIQIFSRLRLRRSRDLGGFCFFLRILVRPPAWIQGSAYLKTSRELRQNNTSFVSFDSVSTRSLWKLCVQFIHKAAYAVFTLFEVLRKLVSQVECKTTGETPSFFFRPPVRFQTKVRREIIKNKKGALCRFWAGGARKSVFFEHVILAQFGCSRAHYADLNLLWPNL